MNKIIQLGNIRKGTPKFSNPQSGRVYSIDGIAPTVNTCQGGGLEPKVLVKENDMKMVCERRIDEGLRTFKDDVIGTIRTIDSGGDKRVIESTVVASRGREDKAYGLTKQKLEPNMNGVTNAITTVQKDNMSLEKTDDIKSTCGYRIRKLTPRECWRLMGFSDEAFDRAAFEKREYDWNDLLCNVKLKDAIEKQLPKSMEIYVSNIINDFKERVATSIGWNLSRNQQEKGKIQNVNIAIIKSEELVHLECVTSTIKCSDFTVMLCGSMEEKDQHHLTVIIELAKGDKQNTGKYMKITLEENLTPMKLSIILTVLKLIIKSKIYTSTLQEVNIQQLTWNSKDCGNNMEIVEISYLKMESIYTRVSSSQLYKQAGNSIVTNVLYYIFKELYEAMPYLFDDLKVGSYFSGIGAFEVGLDKLFDDINGTNFTIPQVSTTQAILRGGEKSIIVYDDYNSNVRTDQNTIGTITTNVGSCVLRKMVNESKPKLVGGFGDINFGKQYRQGNRVYDSKEIAMCLNATPVGNMGGYSYLYLVHKKNKLNQKKY